MDTEHTSDAHPIGDLLVQQIDDVKVSVEAYLGGTEMAVKDLRRLTTDDVVDLQTPLNQSVDLRVNGLTIARGYLVAAGDNFAVKITTMAK